MSRLSVSIDDEEVVHLAGALSEHASFDEVLARAPRRIVLDLGGITHINSFGVREWINFLRTLESRGVTVELKRCSLPMVRQMTMIPSAKGKALLRSTMLPYFCGACGQEREVLKNAGEAFETAPCPTCGASMEFDDAPQAYAPLLQEVQ